jgi:DNA processing protein
MDNGLDIDELRCRIALYCAYVYRAERLCKVFSEFDKRTNRSLFNARLEAQTEALARRYGERPNWRSAEQTLRWLEDPAHRLIAPNDREYPGLLKQLSHPPLLLFVAGRVAVLGAPQVAIVGSRKATHSGVEIAEEFAAQLSERGLTITSGLAIGIDGAAHRGALAASGSTVAVLGSGLDRIYPRRHLRLAAEISECGALLSEFPLGFAPRGTHFPRRNRLISGLALGTVVVEAATRSGSISTAMHALDQGREVFAVPGSIRNTQARGCHRLLKEGAKLAESIDDIIEELPNWGAPITRQAARAPSDNSQNASPELTHSGQRVLEVCDFSATGFDEIVIRTGLTATEVSAILLTLELQGRLSSCGGGAYIKLR